VSAGMICEKIIKLCCPFFSGKITHSLLLFNEGVVILQVKIKELSKEWENELTEIKNHGEYRRLKSFAALLHTCDVLVDTFQKKNRSRNKQNNLYLINHFFLLIHIISVTQYIICRSLALVMHV
jgi:hypothetical protein